MKSKVIVSVDLDAEVTLQLQVDHTDGDLIVTCGVWVIPIDHVHSRGAHWVEENLDTSNLAPALLALDFFADYAKAFTDRVK
jgi:hypothetical protein